MSQGEMFRDYRGVRVEERPVRGKFVPADNDRPPYAVADDWDRMVRMVRARDRMRENHGLVGVDLVVQPGPRPRLVSVENPEIGTDL